MKRDLSGAVTGKVSFIFSFMALAAEISTLFYYF